MNKKNYILNNADTRYFEYFFLKRLRYGRSVVINIDEEGTDYSVTVPKDASFDAIKLKGDTNQTTYSGKNLLNISSEFTVTNSNVYRSIPISIPSGTTIYVQCDNITTNSTKGCSVRFQNSSLQGVGTVILQPNTTLSSSVTLSGDAAYCYVYSSDNYADSQSATTTYTNLMLSIGSTLQPYEPYVGGIASPNPEYPQDVNVVSGSQTIAITSDGNTQQYPISLGSTELCKIGDYQDYIYKDGDDWYVHKEFGQVDLSTLSWDENKYNNCYIRRNTAIPNIKYVPNNRTLGVALAEKYILRIGSGGSGNDAINHIMVDVNAVAVNTGTVANTPVTGLFYYQLATPTNTKITDSTLISQLNALFASGLKSGTNTIKVTAPAGILPTIFNIIINH